MSTTPLRKIETYIRFAGLKRSGSHAVINWLLSQFTGLICFRNNAQKFGLLNRSNSNKLPALREIGRTGTHLSANCDKKVLLVSFEDKPLERVFDEIPVGQYSSITAHAVERYYHILILRDPFNICASRLQFASQKRTRWARRVLEPEHFSSFVKLWKEYAKVFLSFGKVSNHEIAINYNLWLTSEELRNEICGRLAITLSNDNSRLSVPGQGGGSSFVGRNLQTAENYLNRWRAHRNHPFMERLLKDQELVSLSDEIFSKTILSCVLQSSK